MKQYHYNTLSDEMYRTVGGLDWGSAPEYEIYVISTLQPIARTCSFMIFFALMTDTGAVR